MTRRQQGNQTKKKTLKGFESDRWVLDPRKMVKLKTKCQKLKNQSQKDK